MSSEVPLKRPGYGKSCQRTTTVLANYFEIKKPPSKLTWHRYDIEIKKPYSQAEGSEGQPRREPKPPKTDVKRKVFRELENKKGKEWFSDVGYFFDNERTLYSNAPIKMKTNVVTTSVLLEDDQDLSGKPNEFQVQIAGVTDPLDLSELKTYVAGKIFRWEFFNMESLRALNSLVHVHPSHHYFQFNDSILDPQTRVSLGGGMELWAGFFESVRPGENTFFVNVNRTHTVFFEPKSLDVFLCEHLNMGRLPEIIDEPLARRISKIIRNLKVRPLHRPKVNTRQPIRGLSPKKASEFEFTLKDTNETTNVQKYFKKTYDINLKYQHMVEIATRKDEVWPLECCGIIEGQRVPLTYLTGDQLGKMITITALSPRDGKNMILNEGIRKVLNFGNDPKLKEFGMKIDERMADVPGRILEVPVVSYHSSSSDGPTIKPNFGSWNLRGRKFVKSGVPLANWFVISCIPEKFLPRKDAQDFIMTLVKTCKSQGMQIEMERPRIQYPNINGNFAQTIRTEYNNSRNYLTRPPQLIMFLLPPESFNKRKKKRFPDNVYDRKLNQRLYRDIKLATSTILGIPSQCVIADNIFEGPSYCANVALKMNLKLGGINSTLDANEIPQLTKEPVMLLGADVTHPGPESGGGDDIPSICSVVGSVDQHGSRFIDRHREQKRTKEGSDKNISEEKIIYMREMVADILKEYHKRNAFFPKRIVMYRDGVSESQYKMVLDYELKAIRDACRDIMKTDIPVTFIVVGKRHHTRFYPKERFDTDRNGNCIPGLVVDRKITHPYLFDFFLLSHASLQGTSRPARYVVLCDENKFGVDALQEFSYKICYNYQRATRSVSIPPPVYYAHLSAKHARSHVKDNKLLPVVKSLEQSMYFV